MPGFYADGEYDVAGFVVGVTDAERLIDGSRIRVGDRLVGLPSAGLHTNGYSLARKIFFEVEGLVVDDRVEELGATVGEVLLAEHRCYLAALREPVERGIVRGLAHITGGGIPDNLPRVLPEGTAARVERGAWPLPPLFRFLERVGNVEQREMDRTFNMGIGMIVVVAPDDEPALRATLDRVGEAHYAIGEIVHGAREVRYA
jgi:phosphoribosylformylglycinamidine cyclo-ligase